MKKNIFLPKIKKPSIWCSVGETKAEEQMEAKQRDEAIAREKYKRYMRSKGYKVNKYGKMPYY